MACASACPQYWPGTYAQYSVLLQLSPARAPQALPVATSSLVDVVGAVALSCPPLVWSGVVNVWPTAEVEPCDTSAPVVACVDSGEPAACPDVPPVAAVGSFVSPKASLRSTWWGLALPAQPHPHETPTMAAQMTDRLMIFRLLVAQRWLLVPSRSLPSKSATGQLQTPTGLHLPPRCPMTGA